MNQWPLFPFRFTRKPPNKIQNSVIRNLIREAKFLICEIQQDDIIRFKTAYSSQTIDFTSETERPVPSATCSGESPIFKKFRATSYFPSIFPSILPSILPASIPFFKAALMLERLSLSAISCLYCAIHKSR